MVGKYTVRMNEFIGRGAFCDVLLGMTRRGKTIAAKRISLQNTRKARTISDELHRLKLLDHPNIVKIFDVYAEHTVLWIMMEYCQIGDLKGFFQKVPQNLRKKVTIMLQIAEGIKYLHSEDIVHRDIKPANILVAQEKPVVVKLTDFDCSKFLDSNYETSCMSTNVGTPAFKAPEFYQRFHEDDKIYIAYHRNVDIFAAGLTFLTIIQGNKNFVPTVETPEHGSERFQPIGQLIAERIKYGKNLEIINIQKSTFTSTNANSLLGEQWSPLAENNEVTQLLRELIRSMTRAEPEDRINANQAADELYSIYSSYIQIRHLGTVDTGLVFWEKTKFTVMDRFVVIFGKSSEKSRPTLNIFSRGSMLLVKLTEVFSSLLFDILSPFAVLCRHYKGVYLQPVKKGNQESLAVSCSQCRNIRLNLCPINITGIASTAFHHPYRLPGPMSAGEEGVLYVMDIVNGFNVMKLNTEQIPFTGPHEIIKSGMDNIYSMIHIPDPHNLLVFSDNTSATIRAVSSITGEEEWVLRGEVNGKECQPHGMFFSQDHQVLLVADGRNRRILVLNPRDGLLVDVIEFDDDIGGVVDVNLNQQKLIVFHVSADQHMRVSFYSIRIFNTEKSHLHVSN